MTDAQTHIIAVCPACSASSKVSFNKLGQHIACPQCRRTFVAGEAFLPDNQRSGERPALPSNPGNDHVERIDAVCPNCHATLHVRRAYIGNDVRCKYCDEIFRVRSTASAQAITEPDQADPRQKVLQAEQEQLYVAHNLLQADHDRLKTEYTELRENLRRVTTELEAIRTALGTIAPEEVGSLANERQSLGEEVHRLRDEMSASLSTQLERDQLLAERQRWNSDLDRAHAERDLLARQLSERDDQLEAARADHDCLSAERNTALSEIDQLRIALAHSDGMAHGERDQLRLEVDNLRRELDRAEQCHRAELDQLNDQLASLREQQRRLEDENDRAQERRGLDDQSSFASEDFRSERSTGQRPVLGILSAESESEANPSSTDIVSSGGELSTTTAEIEGLRKQVAELGQRLDESEQLHREMAATLEGIGIRCWPTRV